MNLSEFLSAREPSWREMDVLLREAERRELFSLPHERARRLVDLYRRTSADLVQARTFGAGVDMTRYLEALVGRAYALLYQPPPLQGGDALRVFFRDRFPRAVRRERMAFAIVTAAFVVGLALGGIATVLDPEASRLFIPEEHQHMTPRARVSHDEEAWRTGKHVPSVSGHAEFSSFLFTHNIGVTIVCFAIGIAWGLPTLLLIAYHGVFLAALAVAYFQDGVGVFFLAWILPHGVVELTCMLLAGTAGLLLGRGVLWPRGLSRAARVRDEARSGLDLLGGCAALLIVAGLIEGTISQIHEPALPYFLKIGMALLLFGLLWAYLWLMPLPDHSAPRDLKSR